jgi:signal transduction histidine kinase
VRVIDSGIGLDDTSRRHVEDLFHRGLEAVRFESSCGSGLGLYVAKVIIDAHDGELFFSSGGVGNGSVFGFWVPLE